MMRHDPHGTHHPRNHEDAREIQQRGRERGLCSILHCTGSTLAEEAFETVGSRDQGRRPEGKKKRPRIGSVVEIPYGSPAPNQTTKRWLIDVACGDDDEWR
jgi:hypothetical protein